MEKLVTRPHSVKLGHQKGPFRAPFKEKVPFFTIVSILFKNLGKAPLGEIDIGSYVDGSVPVGSLWLPA